MTTPEREPDVRFRFGHDLRAVNAARRHLDRLVGEPDDVIADDVRLAASELVTNVIAHTDGGGELRAWDPRPDVPLRVEVEDEDGSPPVTADRAPGEVPAIGGRGLTIVAAVSDTWGYQHTLNGKVVWAEFDRDKRRLAQLADRGSEPDDPARSGPIAPG